MRDYLKQHQDRVTKLSKKVAYQRNCQSRLIPHEIWVRLDAALDEVFELIGVERVARKYDHEDALCCGGVVTDPEKRDKIQEMNVTDAKAHGAEAMTYVCGGCAAISMACYRHGLAPIYIVNLVRMALGERRYPA
jgi:heterodisulfide reductase subunit B